MTDFSVPNTKPGKCAKCNGSGKYRWAGHTENGVWKGKEGPCHSCRGTGQQDWTQIKRNECWNRHKVVTL